MVSSKVNHRDYILNQLGITQYQLVKPSALHGEVLLTLPGACRLIVVAPADFDIQSALFQDLIRAMALTTEQIFVTQPEHVIMLHDIQEYALFIMGDTINDKQLPPVACVIVCPDFALLGQQADAKKHLWQQICQNEHYFFS